MSILHNSERRLSAHSEATAAATFWQSFLGTLPFIAFGLACILNKNHLPYTRSYNFLAFYLLTLVGLGVGWVKGFPRWSYIFLSWAVIFAWWWSGMWINGRSWEWRIWIPFVLTILIALLVTRSFNTLRRLVNGIWNDWSILSLGGYTLYSHVLLLYDEDHRPQLIIFMTISTIIVAAGAWGYMRGRRPSHRVFALLAGILLALVFPRIGDGAWANIVSREVILPALWIAGVLLTPALLGLLRRAVTPQRARPS